MRILIDTDVLLDFALGRKPFDSAAKSVIMWAEANSGYAEVAWHSVSNIAYLAPVEARAFLRGLLDFVEIQNAGTADAMRALQSPMNDIEDALQAFAALAFNADYVVTRNTKDYRRSPVPAISPKEFLLKINR
jgi:predicted nucleic acid-binding protein